MKGQKQSRVDKLEKDLLRITKLLEAFVKDYNNTKTLAFGTLETIKQFKEYGKAIETLKEKSSQENGSAKEAEAGGEDSN